MTSSPDISSLDILDLRSQYISGTISPLDVVRHVYKAISSYADKAVWIYVIPESEALGRAEELMKKYGDTSSLPPLFGIPFSVKDSVDIVGLQTTLACPSFAFTAKSTAPAVERVLEAGGILIGKTNLDQFATGLTGVRSPWGAPRCVYDSDYISGGSSSGSAVSVAASIVSFTVCTDTGGSTRMPAALNGVVGLKPTLGTISSEGLFPACKNIDCVCVIARTMDDAKEAWSVMRAYDENDIFARREVPIWEPWHKSVRIGIPSPDLLSDLTPIYGQLFSKAVTLLQDSLECTLQPEFDYTPFNLGNNMLYDSSIVSQRLLAFESYISSSGLDLLHPAIRDTFQAAAAKKFSAERAYQDIFEMVHLRRQAEIQFRNVDVLVVPATIGHFTVAEINEDHMARNKAMGRFTNFANVLDLCAVSVPVGWWENKNGKEMPFGITLIAQAGKDEEIMELGKNLMNLPRLRLEK